MTDIGVLSKLYSKSKTAIEFNFDQLWAPPIYNYLSAQDIAALYEIATSLKLSAKINIKYDLINRIMTNRGFKKFAAGTNRVVYSYLEDESFVVKIAIDRVGLKDNPAEFYNQAYLQPYVTKCFSVTPCGTVGMFERVQPIINKQEFISIAEDVFNIIVLKLIGKHVVDDFGEKYYMNWGVRRGFGPCLLDYPYVYELDSEKLYCNQYDQLTHTYCGGVIDYDAGFNDLMCTKCGKKYIPRELEKNKKENLIITGGQNTMKVRIVKQDGTVIANSERSSDYIVKTKPSKQNEGETKKGLKVSIKVDKKVIKKETDIENIKEKIKLDISSKFIPKPEDKKEDEIPSNEDNTVECETTVLVSDLINKNGQIYSKEAVEKSIENFNVEDKVEIEDYTETDEEESNEDIFSEDIEENDELETPPGAILRGFEDKEKSSKKTRKRDSKGRFVKITDYFDDEDDYIRGKKNSRPQKNDRRNKNLDKF